MNKNGKSFLMFGALFVAVALLSSLVTGVPTQAQASTKTAICPSTSTLNASLYDRSKIQLDRDEHWVDNANYKHIALIPFLDPWDEDLMVGCNSACGSANVIRNHYGLFPHAKAQSNTYSCAQGHAWSYTFSWQSTAGAYTVANAMPWRNGLSDFYSAKFTDCTAKYWNVSGKKTANHTRIQSWNSAGAKKPESLFWVSTKGGAYIRIWSALSGRPVGFVLSDTKNLKTLDLNEDSTIQWFYQHEISENDIGEL